jgi:hypothetical protein
LSVSSTAQRRSGAGDAHARQLRGCPPPHGHAAARARAACVHRGCSYLRAARAGRSHSPFLHLTRRRFALLHLRRARHTGELLLPPISSRFTAAAAPSRNSYLSSCAGPPGKARNRHPAASLSSPTAVTGESFPPCAPVQSLLLAAMLHPSGRFPSVPEAREAL